jgi:hypothetical protein
MSPIPICCDCGSLRGELRIGPQEGVRIRCHCDDCQAYARWLGTRDVLDERGGSELVQTWPARIVLQEAGPLSLLRLSPTGLLRWYAGCCRAPIANSIARPGLPFTGVFRRALSIEDGNLDVLLGPALGVQGRFAPGGCPPGVSPRASFPILLGSIRLLTRGWWQRAARPSPWFDASGHPVRDATVLTRKERAGLDRSPASTLAGGNP